MLLNAALVALVVALLVALLLAQWLARPLRRLTVTSRLLAEGHLDARVAIPDQLATGGAGAVGRLQRHGRATAGVGRHHQRRTATAAASSWPTSVHELRTPIAAMRTFNELLLEGAAEDPETREEFLRGSRQQLERLDWLAANLLELSKLDSGLVALQLRDEDLRTVAEDAVDHAEPMAERKGVELRTHLPDEPVIQPHDPPRLGQVLGNLIGNAIKFTPSGGARRRHRGGHRRWRRVHRQRTTASASTPTSSSTSSIASIAGPAGREERAGGSGLGLAIARSIVDMHHGRVSISSTPDVGTEVLVTLPRDIEASSPADARG